MQRCLLVNNPSPSSQEEARPHTSFFVWQLGKLRPEEKWLLQGPWGKRTPVLGLPRSAAQEGFLEEPPQWPKLSPKKAWPYAMAFGGDAKWLSPAPVPPGLGCPCSLPLAGMISRKSCLLSTGLHPMTEAGMLLGIPALTGLGQGPEEEGCPKHQGHDFSRSLGAGLSS